MYNICNNDCNIGFLPNLNKTWILPDKDLVLTVAVGWHEFACMFRPSKVTHLRQDVIDVTTSVSDRNGRRGKCIVRKYLTASVDRLHRLAGQSVPKPIWQEFIYWTKNSVSFRDYAPISKGTWQKEHSKTWCIYQQCRPRWQEDHDDEVTRRWLSQQPGVQCTLRGGNSIRWDCGIP